MPHAVQNVIKNDVRNVFDDDVRIVNGSEPPNEVKESVERDLSKLLKDVRTSSSIEKTVLNVTMPAAAEPSSVPCEPARPRWADVAQRRPDIQGAGRSMDANAEPYVPLNILQQISQHSGRYIADEQGFLRLREKAPKAKPVVPLPPNVNQRNKRRSQVIVGNSTRPGLTAATRIVKA